MDKLFRVDLSQVRDVYSLDKNSYDNFRDYTIKRVVSRFVRDVESMANRELHMTRNEYLRSLNMESPNKGVVVVELNGFLANAIENGFSAFDQKKGFKRSPNAKSKLDGGWYLTIPFGHSNPEATGDFSTLGEPMPEEVYEEAKDLSGGEPLVDRGQLPRLPPRAEVRSNTRVYDAYIRKHSPYEGMIKSTRPAHAGYVTFRRVSDKSDDNSWIHSGFEARKFFEKAYNEERLIHEVDVARDIFVSQL